MLWQTCNKEAMYNMISRFFRPIKEGFYGVGRHAAMSFSSASAVTITLFIISVFLMFSFNVQQFTQNVEQTVQIAVMVDYAYEDQAQIDRIGLDISNIDGVKDVKFSSKDNSVVFFFIGKADFIVANFWIVFFFFRYDISLFILICYGNVLKIVFFFCIFNNLI